MIEKILQLAFAFDSVPKELQQIAKSHYDLQLAFQKLDAQFQSVRKERDSARQAYVASAERFEKAMAAWDVDVGVIK